MSVSENIESLRQRGIQLFDDRSWRDALTYFDRVVLTEPHDAEIHNYRARSLEALHRYDDALHCVEQALKINPANAADLRNRAVLLTKLERLSEALESYDAVLRHRPDDMDVLLRKAMLLNRLERREDSLTVIERVVAVRPNDLDCLNAKVIVLDTLGQYGDALQVVDRMLSLAPTHLDAINNSAMLLARIGRFQEALTCYNKSLAIAPEQPQVLYNRSLIRLALGDWIRGFQEFESRWMTSPLTKNRLQGLVPLWLGGEEDLNKKTLFVYHEQGYGDTLQCVRYIPLLAERGAKVILGVPPPLATLMHSVAGVFSVITEVNPLPAHDYQCPLMSLPLAFRTTPDTVPSSTPYLSADRSAIATWAARLVCIRRPRVGIAWSGRRYAPINYPRDIALSTLKPLLKLPAEFISLQKEMTEADRVTLAKLSLSQNLIESVDDFAQTAALVTNLDLVITVDTAIAHLAGALGKPVWLMNRYGSCWRWLQDRSDSPWYPTLRQFRQKTVNDWTGVIVDVQTALSQFLAECANAQLAVSENPSRGRNAPVASTPPKEKIRFVCATRLSHQEFFAKAPLGRSLPIYREFPKRQVIELRLFANNQQGLSSVYNVAIEEARSDPGILVFIHDDVYLSDFYWAEHLRDALQHFDLVGLAGNKRRVPRQASWMFLDDQFTRDNYDNLSGVLGHGDAFPDLKQLSVYGEPGQEVKLLDGVMMAIRSPVLIDKELRFDPQFHFDFYDLDFCRQAELRGIRMGTWAISVVHASAGALGVARWRQAYARYLNKYQESA